MTSFSEPIVGTDSHLTLHYRLIDSSGKEIISTFDERPATLQLGQGQLAPFLEACLIGLKDDAQECFELLPERAFGLRNTDLIQRVSRTTLAEQSDPDADYRVGDLVDFAAPGGGRFAGVLLEMGGDSALFDFNHPLAGQTLRFDVKLFGIL